MPANTAFQQLAELVQKIVTEANQYCAAIVEQVERECAAAVDAALSLPLVPDVDSPMTTELPDLDW